MQVAAKLYRRTYFLECLLYFYHRSLNLTYTYTYTYTLFILLHLLCFYIFISYFFSSVLNNHDLPLKLLAKALVPATSIF